jgi:hypothetical protein
VAAEEHIWAMRATSAIEWIAVRNDAVKRALAAGWSREDIATALHVLPLDVDRMCARA